MNTKEVATLLGTSITNIHSSIHRKGEFRGLKPILTKAGYEFDAHQVKMVAEMWQYLKDYYTTQEVANILFVTKQTIKNAVCKNGEFRGVKPVKIAYSYLLLWDKKEINALKEKRRVSR